MKFLWTTSSQNALKEIKIRIIKQYKIKDQNKIKIKFTKKKEFIAVPIPFFNFPAFSLYINEKFYKTFLLKNKEWEEH